MLFQFTRKKKKISKNYRPVSFLPIFGRNFERLVFNSLFKYLDEYELLNPNQSGFRPFDSCVNQFLSINHEIFSNFDCDPPEDMHTVFLDISKAFDKIWLPGFIFKIKSFGISGDFFFKLKFTPCKAEQPLQGMELQETQKRFQNTENLFRKNLQLKDVC